MEDKDTKHHDLKLLMTSHSNLSPLNKKYKWHEGEQIADILICLVNKCVQNTGNNLKVNK